MLQMLGHRFFSCLRLHYLKKINTNFNSLPHRDAFANRAKPGQAALNSYKSCLIRVYSVCLWKYDMSRDMWFQTMWHFDMCSHRRACTASFFSLETPNDVQSVA